MCIDGVNAGADATSNAFEVPLIRTINYIHLLGWLILITSIPKIESELDCPDETVEAYIN